MARAGAFRERARFEAQAVTGQDAYAQDVTAWGHVATLWADLREQPGKEALQSGRLQSTTVATLRIRESATAWALSPADSRVLVRGRTWNIRSGPIRVGDRPGVLELTLEAGVAGVG